MRHLLLSFFLLCFGSFSFSFPLLKKQKVFLNHVKKQKEYEKRRKISFKNYKYKKRVYDESREKIRQDLLKQRASQNLSAKKIVQRKQKKEWEKRKKILEKKKKIERKKYLKDREILRKRQKKIFFKEFPFLSSS